MSTEPHLHAVIDPGLRKFVVTLKHRGKSVRKTMSLAEFSKFTRTDGLQKVGAELVLVGDNRTKVTATMDPVQQANVREYLEWILDGGRRYLERSAYEQN